MDTDESGIIEIDNVKESIKGARDVIKIAKRYHGVEHEFISGICKTDRFLPVVTLVLYYGEEDWDGPMCLHDMLDIPEEIKKYINDYRLNIIQIKDNNLQLHNEKNKDLFEIMSGAI